MATTALDKIRRRTKQIQRETGKSFRAAQKEAGREYRATVSGRKKSVGKVHKKKRVGAKKKYIVHHVVERVGKLTYRDGAYKIGALSIAQARQEVKSKMAWELLAKESAKNVRDKKAAAKKVRALKELQRNLDKV